MKIAILQVGIVEQNVLKHLQESILKVFPQTESVILKDVMMLPPEAYDPRRRQYHSGFLLNIIKENLGKTDVDKILGITTVDLYVPQLNFVFGEAEPSGKAAIISLYRREPEFYGKPVNQTLFLERAVKEAVHEIGHVVELTHCFNRSCVMSFSNAIGAVDVKRWEPCPKCSKRLLKLVR